MRRKGPAYLSIATWMGALLLSATPFYASSLTPPLDRFISNGGFITTSGGAVLEAHMGNGRFIPASTIKIATALAAIQVLGPSHRFKTEFFLNSTRRLVIRGHGDPFLTSEYISEIGRELKNRGLDRIDGITIDDSLFSVVSPVDGSSGTSNPYDAPNGALIVNFNTLAVACNQNTAASGEPQTPFLPLMRDVCTGMPEGSHRVNVSAFSNSATPDYSLRYSCELFAALFREQGIETGALCGKGAVDNQAIPVYTYTSRKTLTDLIADCLEYSNNYLANQLFLSCGAATYGYPATWEKARRCLVEVLSEKLRIDISGMTLHEGSGLSLNNRISPSFMISVLEAFKPFARLLPGREHALIKSGTMTGIYCYAGYLKSEDRLDPFVIFLNQQDNTRKEVFHELHRKYRSAVSRHPVDTDR